MIPKHVPVAAFVVLDVSLIVSLLSMLLCMHPVKFDFVSEWMRQCKLDRHTYALPFVMTGILILIVLLQLNWMFLVSLHHLTVTAQVHAQDAHADRRQRRLEQTRTRMLTKLFSELPQKPCTCVTGNSDAAFMACAAAVVGSIAILYYDWTSAKKWLHFYGVFLFCAGFFVVLQIIWSNLQKASSVATLRHMTPIRGMHWAIDTVIVLACLLFLTANFALGQIGPWVVGSELVAFFFLMLQFQYVFYICCCSVPAQLPTRSCSASSRFWFCVLLLGPFLATDNL
jgi:hypothetical protein